jgi:type II secretion system protein D
LNEAITAAQASVTAQAVTGAAAQATAARATPPAVNLQFLDIGPEGQRMIRSGIMANVRIVADAQSNTLIVVGPPAAMGLMEALIARLDALPGTEAQIKVFTVQNADATALAEMLQNLFGTAAAGAQAAAPGLATGTGAGESAIVPLRFSVDQRTNSIIASGNAGDLNVIHAILLTLDQGDIRTRNTVVYRLRFAPAPDVANALSTLLAQQLTLIQTAPELVTPVEVLERQVIVVAEPVTNSLIISATSRYFPDIQRIIADIDRRPPMIVIQVLLAEVTLNDTEQFGIEWGLQDAFMFDRGIPAAAGAALQPGYAFNTSQLPNQNSPSSLATRNNVATQSLTNFSLARADPTLGFGGLVLTASSESVNVLLRALEQSSRAQVISRPQVQTMDNVPAFVQVGALVPRIQGATATGLTVTPIVQDINVGIVLNVTPRVSPDGTVVMQVYAEKSSVGSDVNGIPVFTDANGNVVRSPQIPRTLAQTTVSARTGQTVVLGGLITRDQTEVTRRVPYLGDVPVLGRLFRFDSVIRQRTELLVILTPYLVQTDEQVEWINQRESERMSWCIADIVNIQGPVSMAGSPFMNPAGTPVIFPDLQPGAPTPAEAPLPPDMQLSPFPPYPPGLPLPPQMTFPPGHAPPEPATPSTPPPGTTPPPAAPVPNPPPSGHPYFQPMSDDVQRSSRRDTSQPVQPAVPASVIVPRPAAPMQPPEAGHAGGLAPRPIEPVLPPAGTQARLAPARLPDPAAAPPVAYPAPPQGTAAIAPAVYQTSP